VVKFDFSKAISTKSRILAAIRHFKIISIKNLASYCKISIPIVARYVESMLTEGLLKEQITTVSASGRKPKLFSLNEDYGYIVGIEFGLLYLAKTGVFSFDGSLMSSATVSYTSQSVGTEIVDSVMNSIEHQFAENSLDPKKILYIVIANPGVVNPLDGTMEMAAEFASWRHLPVKHMFSQRFSAPVDVLNDVNLSAIGEKDFGVGHGYNNFILIRQTIGLKAGIILKNRLYQGETLSAGEIGNSILFFKDSKGISRRRAESCLSLPAVCKEIASGLCDDPDDIFYSITGGNPENVNVNTIVKALGTNSYVDEHIFQFGESLGYLLQNVVAALDIALVILSGDVTKLSNYYIKPMRDVLAEHLSNPPTVLISSLGDDVALYGAFAVAQERILDSIS